MEVPTMAQWVKNLTTVVQVTVEVWVQSLAWCNGWKDPRFLHLQCRSQLWLRFNSWLRNFHMPWVWLLRRKEVKKLLQNKAIYPCTIKRGKKRTRRKSKQGKKKKKKKQGLSSYNYKKPESTNNYVNLGKDPMIQTRKQSGPYINFILWDPEQNILIWNIMCLAFWTT